MFACGQYSPLLVCSEKKKSIEFRCPEVFEMPLFGSDEMEAYFLSSLILFKKWARNLWQESVSAECGENNQVWKHESEELCQGKSLLSWYQESHQDPVSACI